MLVRYTLFTMWIVLHLADLALSWVASLCGATEVGILWHLNQSWLAFSIEKMALAVAVGILLVYFRLDRVLVLADLGMLGVVIWCVAGLLVQTKVLGV